MKFVRACCRLLVAEDERWLGGNSWYNGAFIIGMACSCDAFVIVFYASDHSFSCFCLCVWYFDMRC
jgi:hypothetical protein